jgi:hypothetical protein
MVLDDPDGFGCDPVHGHPCIVAVSGIAGGNVCGGSGCVFVCIDWIHEKSPLYRSVHFKAPSGAEQREDSLPSLPENHILRTLL